ncbi:MAG: Ig-like domain-containing protein, partial [Acholeplasma sp.]
MRKIVSLVFALFGLFALVACDPAVDQTEDELKALYLDQTTLTLEIGETYQLVVTKDPTNDDTDLNWSSTDTSVAEVSQEGLISALASGTATIRVSAENGVSASMNLTVIEALEDAVTSLPIEYNFDQRPSGLNSAYSGGGFNDIEDGILHMGTVGTGTSQASIIFDEALKETTVIETRMKVNTVAFTNAVFLYTSGTSINDVVVALAFENNSIKYHSGAGWTNVMSHQMDTWYDLKLVINIGSRSLNETKGDFDLYVNEAFIGNYSFRNGGDGYEDNIYALRFGSDKANSDFSYDYMKVYYATKPTLTLTESSKTLNLESDSVAYEVLYTTTGNPEVSITSDAIAGYTVDENMITFTAAGTYTFKVRATTGAGFVERTLIITVEG